MRFLLWALAIAIGECLGIYAADLLAQSRGITLVGQLWPSGNGECQYFTDPENESASINLSSVPQDYLCDWLEGTAKHGTRVVITITPEPK
jgi:hypothetical protein